MRNIRVVLWDIDGTLLDFEAAEKYAIRACFTALGLGECTDAMLADYSGINRKYWQRLERGELTKPQVLEGRFLEFFSKYGLDTGCVAQFNARYQVALGTPSASIRTVWKRFKPWGDMSFSTPSPTAPPLPRSGSWQAPVWISCWTGSSSPKRWEWRNLGWNFSTGYFSRLGNSPRRKC